MSKICKTCGAELSESAKFYRKCGAQAGASVNLKTEAGEKADLANIPEAEWRLGSERLPGGHACWKCVQPF